MTEHSDSCVRSWVAKEASLFLSSSFNSLLDTSVGVLVCVSRARPVELGLGHVVTLGDRLGPCVGGISSTLDVESSVVLEDSSLLDVLGVTFVLLGLLSCTGLLVLFLSQSTWDVGLGTELSDVGTGLSSAGTVVVLGLLRSEKVHVGDSREDRLTYSSGGTASGGRGESLSGGNDGNKDSNTLHD